METSAKAGFNVKALFRKIAASLPGMEAGAGGKADDLVNVQLTPSTVALGGAGGAAPAASGCAC